MLFSFECTNHVLYVLSNVLVLAPSDFANRLSLVFARWSALSEVGSELDDR